jgi:hypothetical protein
MRGSKKENDQMSNGVEQSKGVEQRAQMDTETVRALLLINGGGIATLLGVFSQVIGKGAGYGGLGPAILEGVVILMLGLASAVIHNQLRRKCSLHYERHEMHPPKGRLFGVTLWEPTVCCWSSVFMWLSIASFIAAGTYVAFRGIAITAQLPLCP